MIYLKKIALILTPLIFLISTNIYIYKYLNIPSLNNKNILIFISILTFLIFLYFILFTNKKTNTIKEETSIKSPLLDDTPIQLNKKRIIPIKNMIKNYSFDNSFSMALIGKWGSGKSSYLKTLEKELKDDYEIISINVWQLENSKNITNELKKELDNIIFRYNKAIWLTQLIRRLFIQDYFSIVSKYLTKSTIKSSFTFEPTLKESKDRLSGILKEVLKERKIILLIDELDRINSEEEILNIFKIIHYVDDFKNIFTITAMDIEQIKKRIENIDYIHKIFNLKYLLPSIDKNEIIKYYQDKIFDKSKNFIEKDKFEEIIKTSSVINAISNYRIIKNSFNDTIVFISALKEKYPTDWNEYISFKFIFIMNLIKAVDFEFYSYMVLKQKLFTLIKFSEIQDDEKNIDKQKEFFEKEPLLEKISKNLDFEKLLNLLSKSESQNKLKQSFDIYQSHDIENHHITETRYEEFLSDNNNFQNYFNNLKFSIDKSKLLLNLLYKISSKPQDQKILLSTLINTILSIDISLLELHSLREHNNIYGFYKEKEIGVPHIYTLATKSFVHEENREELLKLTKGNQKLSSKFIHYLLGDFSKQENVEDYDTKLIGELLENSLKYLDSLDLEENYIYHTIIQFIQSISSKNIDNILFLYKILYSYSEGLKKQHYSARYMIEFFHIEEISPFLEKLGVTIDDFIVNEHKYSIYPKNKSSSQNLMGKELKEELKKLKLETNE